MKQQPGRMSHSTPMTLGEAGAGSERTNSDRREEDRAGPSARVLPFFWPLYAASTMQASASAALSWYLGLVSGPDAEAEIPQLGWTTPNRVRLELPTMRLRDFSTCEGGPPAIICAPYALHGATIADFAPRHSVVEALQRSGVSRLAVTEWLSADAAMQHFSIDTYLADLNVAIDEIGAPVDLIGLCQGGWMALVYAARFPEKVRRLVLVGAPVDVRATTSQLMQAVDALPLSAFENLVRLGEGRVLGRYALKLWGSATPATDAANVLQVVPDSRGADITALRARFEAWHAQTVDLPGTYYMQVVQWIFKENRIAEGRFVALGRTLDLRTVRAPMYLLAGSDDEVIGPDQLFAAARLTSTSAACIEMERASCGHLGLFMGADTISGTWPRIGKWLLRDLDMALAS